MNREEERALAAALDGWLEREDPRGGSLLVITPDATRTCPLPEIAAAIQDRMSGRYGRVDYLVALGTHRALDEGQLRRLYGLDGPGAAERFAGSRFLNHRWDLPDTLVTIGRIGGAELAELSGGRLTEDLEVQVNRIIFDYDKILVVSPVFPHEVVGYSGGVKYFFPGISGGDFVQKFHWLGGLLGASSIIGHFDTAPRRIIEAAARFLDVDVSYLTLAVGPSETVEGCFLGPYPEAWRSAAELSARVNVVRYPKQFHTVIGLAQRMFTEIWTAGKVMYKLERMVEPGGRLIIYGPHIERISYTWEKWIRMVGYHTRDYLLAHPELMEGVPPGIFAQSCYVKGMGRYENGVERPRIDVTLCTGIDEATCRAINLSYLDPAGFDVDSYRGREDEGYLVVDNAGEVLYLPDRELPW